MIHTIYRCARPKNVGHFYLPSMKNPRRPGSGFFAFWIMKTVILLRYKADQDATLGLVLSFGFQCYSLELPWRDNATNRSCIPTGKYQCVWTNSKRFGGCYLVTDVPKRSGILFHRGNTSNHTWGCILLGKKAGCLEQHPAVLISRPTVRSFNDHFNQQPFQLEVYNV